MSRIYPGNGICPYYGQLKCDMDESDITLIGIFKVLFLIPQFYFAFVVTPWFFILLGATLAFYIFSMIVSTIGYTYKFSTRDVLTVKEITEKYLNLPREKRKEYSEFLTAIYEHYSKYHDGELSKSAIDNFEKMLDMHQPEKINRLADIDSTINRKYDETTIYLSLMGNKDK